ncbi:MAG: accessory factor UbiK family protein [Wenzhouxiangella sp.]
MRPDFQTIDDITRRLAESVPEELKSVRVELERQFKTVLENAFSRLDLVTREEFEIQKKVLLRTREKLERLEALLAEKDQAAAD